MTLENLLQRFGIVLCLGPLVMLAGCPKQDDATSAKPPASATAPALPGPASASSAAVQAVSQANDAARSMRAERLIAQVEKAYQSGVSNYRAGRLDAARQDFDLAVDTMLASGLDLKKDPQLSDELERLLNQINSLEMDALKQGNGLSPVLEAAPLDEAANEATFPANPELTQKLKKELTISTSDLPLVINDQVAGYIGYFANSPSFHAHMLRSMERAGKYKTMMQQVLKEEGVPQDLIYLAVAESGFQPQAMNAGSGAGGIWQFMPTGAYGLARSGWVDERFDPEKSTRAYAKYMKALYSQFGDWYLAMAGYDWGPGNVQKAVMRTGYADFWELYRRNAMPKETKAYVPQILAAVIMAKNPEKYGLDKMVPMPAVVYDTVTTDYPVDLRLVADLTDATVQEVVALNPSLLRVSTPSSSDFDLHIPVGTKDVYLDRIKAIPDDKRISWRFHTVKPGESLEGIATSLHARPLEIAETNGIGVAEAVAPGDELVIPLAAVSGGVGHAQRYTIKHGDTIAIVADRFNVSPEDLRGWNHLSSSALKPGRVLSVSAPLRLAPAMRSHVKRGRVAAAGRTKAAYSKAISSKASRGSGAKSKASSAHATTRTKSTATSSHRTKH
ncbi:membrane-bound lytic murein transglycosylase D [Granulicella aggregans]|uniref:Membrane-bound lytic murein transglycosylase D n=1 Tax=Granulicella aggregans TaxID=474949 RepID=A0A7W8E313_9BACT|nr:lytic transglycosylase domain-containing protein [Granulicella aggregans]MBB5057092.1 membrane-bound lytic murein transglycosylase D [Granulicella aggregans]